MKGKNGWIIRFYTQEPKPPEIYRSDELGLMIERITELTKKKALFAVYELGECINDFS